MKQKIMCLLMLCVMLCVIMLCLFGWKYKSDFINVYNRSSKNSDNIYIDIKEGYFYHSHTKFVVDENTVCVAILFTNDSDTEWKELE